MTTRNTTITNTTILIASILPSPSANSHYIHTKAGVGYSLATPDYA